MSDLLDAMSRLPPAQIAPLLPRMARRALSMEPIHRQPSTMISIANAQLLAGGTGEELFAQAMSEEMPLGVSPMVENAEAVDQAMKLRLRAAGHARAGDVKQARQLAEQALHIGRPAMMTDAAELAALGFFDLAAAALSLVPEEWRWQARGLAATAATRDHRAVDVEPLVEELLTQGAPRDGLQLSVAVTLARTSPRAWDFAFMHRANTPSDGVRVELIEAMTGLE